MGKIPILGSGILGSFHPFMLSPHHRVGYVYPCPAMPVALTTRRSKEIASLARKKHRDRLGQVLVEGLRAVDAAVAAQVDLVDLVIAKTAWPDARVQALVDAVDGPVYVVPDRDFNRLSEVQTSQGVLAVVERRLLATTHLTSCATILALDGVQDPGNVGALIRTAAWFGVDAVLAGLGTADVFQPKVVRATMGGLWDVSLAQTADLAETLRHLQGQGFACYGADLSGTAAAVWTPRASAVLIMGSEAHGLSPAVRALLNERVVLSGAATRAGTESLNVAIAAGILMYEWMGKR